MNVKRKKKTEDEEEETPKKSKKLKTITVKVFRAHSAGKEVALNGDRSIAAALKAAGLSQKDTEIVTVNGEEVEDDYELSDGDKVVLVKNIEGGGL